MTHGTTISILPFSHGWRQVICVPVIKLFLWIMVIALAIGSLPRMVNLSIRTVPFIFGLECGKKAVGRNGPQIVLGANDVIGDSWNGGSLSKPSELNYGNGFHNRYYLAITKHFYFESVGTLGAHLSWIYSNRFDNKLNNPAMGANFRFHLKESDSWVHKAINGVNLMAEVVPGYTDVKEDLIFESNGAKYQVNLGFEYSFWKDYINAIVELNRCKYFSGGLVFKLHLK